MDSAAVYLLTVSLQEPFCDMRQLIRGLRRALASSLADYATTTKDIDSETREIFNAVEPFTMTGLVRVHALVSAVEYVVREGVPGAFAECGVWRGGSVLAMLLKLLRLGATDREIYLYDTFDGMTVPGGQDTSRFERPALETWRRATASGRKPWDRWFKPERFTFEEVKKTILSSGYPSSRINFIQGQVEDTIPRHVPETIALLRLDTDWFQSTFHELVHLYPRVSRGGILLVDDYGHWDGCRMAVDQYFSENAPRVMLNRIDYTARIGVKI